MAFGVPSTGIIESWGSSTDFTNRLVTSYNAPVSTSISLTSDVIDSTVMSSDGAFASNNIKGLRSISGSFKAFLATPRLGSSGLLTYGTYGPFARSYEVNISCPTFKATVFNATPPEWESYVSGRYGWTFNAECMVDDATAISGAGIRLSVCRSHLKSPHSFSSTKGRERPLAPRSGRRDGGERRGEP